MTPARIAATALLLGWLYIATAFLTGCQTLRLGLATDYGTFSYELPMPTSTK